MAIRLAVAILNFMDVLSSGLPAFAATGLRGSNLDDWTTASPRQRCYYTADGGFPS